MIINLLNEISTFSDVGRGNLRLISPGNTEKTDGVWSCGKKKTSLERVWDIVHSKPPSVSGQRLIPSTSRAKRERGETCQVLRPTTGSEPTTSDPNRSVATSGLKIQNSVSSFQSLSQTITGVITVVVVGSRRSLSDCLCLGRRRRTVLTSTLVGVNTRDFEREETQGRVKGSDPTVRSEG